MKIGIIGSGNVGKALAKAAVRAGHSLKVRTLLPTSDQHPAVRRAHTWLLHPCAA